VLYNLPAIARAGQGVNAFAPKGEGKVEDLTAAGRLATTVVALLALPPDSPDPDDTPADEMSDLKPNERSE
jgi:hypothetical protein